MSAIASWEGKNMKKVLYLSNIEVPYRVRFFCELAKRCDLTVVYERECSNNRDNIWAKSEKNEYKAEYLNGIKIGNESSFSFGIFKYIFGKYDAIIVGCYNTPVQMLAILLMKLFNVSYIVNLDGEVFLEEKNIKNMIKKMFLRGAKSYLVAGERAAKSIERVANGRKIVPYYFSSLSDDELIKHREAGEGTVRDKTVLVVGQYFDYKGLDIAIKVAKKNTDINYKFVGMGKRTELFAKEQEVSKLQNVEVISFLQKEELEKEYKKCALLLLPSRRECWGLVVNEAASFGMPIVSTWGSGAAVEFLGDKYPEYLAMPGDSEELYNCVVKLLNSSEVDVYKQYLFEKSKLYSIEKSVEAHMKAIDTRVGEE